MPSLRVTAKLKVGGVVEEEQIPIEERSELAVGRNATLKTSDEWPRERGRGNKNEGKRLLS
jgi:hypothetical protein